MHNFKINRIQATPVQGTTSKIAILVHLFHQMFTTNTISVTGSCSWDYITSIKLHCKQLAHESHFNILNAVNNNIQQAGSYQSFFTL